MTVSDCRIIEANKVAEIKDMLKKRITILN